MKTILISALSGLLLCLAICGCGTIAAYQPMLYHDDGTGNAELDTVLEKERKERVYPYYNGVIIDVCLMKYGAIPIGPADINPPKDFVEYLARSPIILFGLVDLPLSACGDTLLVPYIHFSNRRAKHAKQMGGHQSGKE